VGPLGSHINSTPCHRNTSTVSLGQEFRRCLSFATGFTFFFTLLALAVVIAVTWYAPRVTSRGWLVAMGLLLGGVLGNLTDRIFRAPGFLSGHVIDWIQIPHWPVFNLADAAISVAAVLALILSLRNISPITEVR
jgi:signal peptidase II